MRLGYEVLAAAAGCLMLLMASCGEKKIMSASVPLVLDHNRMLVDAEIQRKDGTWRKVSLWVDTGNPDFLMSESLARDLGIDLSAVDEKRKTDSSGVANQPLEIPPPTGVRIGGMPLNFAGVGSMVLFEPRWMFGIMHFDANLPSTVLMQYQVVFDYPGLKLTIAEPGTMQPRGERSPASINPKTGIVQIDADIAGENFSFALDNGASYSFASKEVMARLSAKHPDWPHMTGALGCANIWGYWPDEPNWPVFRVPEIRWGAVQLAGVGLVGLPDFFQNHMSLGEWYSLKAARPVDGFLGPNAFKAFRIEINYADSAVYFEKGASSDSQDIDIVGLTLRLDNDGSYRIIGVAEKDGKSAVEGAAPGDKLIMVDNFMVTGATMGTAVDALRGRPGDNRTLVLERDGRQFKVETKVEHFL